MNELFEEKNAVEAAKQLQTTMSCEEVKKY